MQLGALSNAIEMLQNQGVQGVEFTLNMARVLLLIAEEPALSQKEILQKIDIPAGNIARVIATLYDGTPKKTGLKLISSKPCPYDWRSSRYYLTRKGVELIARITNL